ncbi:YkgJ family cysteine cluster protein [Halorarum halobium]|uniref:YkgJ family cysteine cluster protein n=1 Tax=Halorarum halobium TaxID=3075121 RepID=UPI0028AE0E66|nr:YkgJ family cysteine cluster protein [Halobaculum sp. XH14]
MESLESELEGARALEVGALADAIESIGFECTRCGACCKADDADPHTATVFPDEIRRLQEVTGDAAVEGSSEADGGSEADGDSAVATPDRDAEYDFRDVARPMPYGLTDDPDGSDGPSGETFEWALGTDACGDCTFYREPSETAPGDGDAVGPDEGVGACTVHEDRPLICRTYPFSVALGGTSQPMGEAVDTEGMVRAHECEGLGRDISRSDAEELAAALKERAVRELEEAIGVRDNYEPVETAGGEVVVHDSEGAKRPDGTPLDG